MKSKRFKFPKNLLTGHHCVIKFRFMYNFEGDSLPPFKHISQNKIPNTRQFIDTVICFQISNKVKI